MENKKKLEELLKDPLMKELWDRLMGQKEFDKKHGINTSYKKMFNDEIENIEEENQIQSTGEKFENVMEFLQSNINFIQSEVKVIDAQEELRDRVIVLCNNYNTALANNFWKDGITIFSEIHKVFEGFHAIIHELENNGDTTLLKSLLMCHVADMINAEKENSELIKNWKGITLQKEGEVTFPYLVIRIHAAVYQKEKLNIEATESQIRKRIENILSKGFRCCWVKSETSSVYFELDGTEKELATMPTEGIEL